MDKSEAIVRINKIGKAGKIVATICKVFVIIGMVGVIIGMIAVASIPKDSITVSGAGTVNIHVDGDKLGVTGAESLEQYFKKHGVSIQEEIDSAADIEVKDNQIDISGVSEETGKAFDIHSLVWPLVMLELLFASMLVVIWFSGFLFRDFKTCESPFEEKIVKDLKNIAYAMIGLTVMSSFNQGLDFSLTDPDVYTVGFRIDFAMVIATLLVFALAYIFKYGAVLQQESDETL